ncbi:unnamed protein product [Linum tenue]|uniref:Uncharacterized protein n=1 Tax=Linum tenue TaxID=586396 RepID=A0AAV0RWR6_9ROSI|nr:unnamed protein product [Linum tenue]
MVRLTADLIWKSPHFFNAIKERELDLRGNKIPVIENLGATEVIFFFSNSLLLVSFYTGYVKEFLPKLHSLVLTNNRLVNLVEIDPLASLPKLQFLSLLDNNITKRPNYRLYVIFKLKSLRVLDFKKVKAKERAEAEILFASKEVEEEAKKEVVKPFTPAEAPIDVDVAGEQQNAKVVGPTPEQIIAIKAAIVNSQTLEEVARLEKALSTGQLPADLKLFDEVPQSDTSAGEKDEEMTTDEIPTGPTDMDQVGYWAVLVKKGDCLGVFSSLIYSRFLARRVYITKCFSDAGDNVTNP